MDRRAYAIPSLCQLLSLRRAPCLEPWGESALFLVAGGLLQGLPWPGGILGAYTALAATFGQREEALSRWGGPGALPVLWIWRLALPLCLGLELLQLAAVVCFSRGLALVLGVSLDTQGEALGQLKRPSRLVLAASLLPVFGLPHLDRLGLVGTAIAFAWTGACAGRTRFPLGTLDACRALGRILEICLGIGVFLCKTSLWPTVP